MSENRTQEIVKFLTPLLVGLIGSFIGGGVAWGVMQQRMNEYERRISALESGYINLSKQVNDDRVYLAGELGQIKAKIDALSK